MAGITTKEKIASVLRSRLYKTPEKIQSELFHEYGIWLKVSTVERRLREMAVKGMATSKVYKNTHNDSSHSRWAGVTYNSRRKKGA